MARINVDDKWWVNDPRRDKFVELVGNEMMADGLALKFWRLGQEAFSTNKMVNKKKFMMVQHAKAFLACELAEERDGGIYIKGSKRHDWLKARVEAGRKGGSQKSTAKSTAAKLREELKAASRAQVAEITGPDHKQNAQTTSKHKPHSHSHSHSHSHDQSQFQIQEDENTNTTRNPKPKKPKPEVSDNERNLRRSCWQAYCDAYQSRWKVQPTPNATVYSQVAAFVRRIGSEAPEVLGFYVNHGDSFYVKKGHPVGLALKDAESLHMQWKKGMQITHAKIKQYEQQSHYKEQLERLEKGEI